MKISDTPEGSILQESTDQEAWDSFYQKSEADRKRLSSIFEATGFSLLVDGDFIGAYEGGVWSHSHKYKAYGVLENVYVQDVFTSAGENGEQAAINGNALTGTIVNLIIPSKYQDTLNLAMEDGSIYIAKVLTERETSSYIDPIIEIEEETENTEELIITPQPVVETRSYSVNDPEGNVHTLVITYTDGVRTSVVYDDVETGDVSAIVGTYFAGDVETDVQSLFQ